MKLRRYWEGYLAGTNRGRAFCVIAQDGDSLRAWALFYDQAYGPTVLRARGLLADQVATLELVEHAGWAPIRPLEGTLTVTFDVGGAAAQGGWQTDIGTSGSLRLRATSFLRVRWHVRRATAQLRLLWYRFVPTTYVVGVLGLAIASVFGVCKVSWQALALLLIPAPLLFQNRIAEIVTQLRLKKAGPFEFQQEVPPAFDPARMAAFIDERLRFAMLDLGLAPYTKLLLAWLARGSKASRPEFEAAARSLGVAGENLFATVRALAMYRCVNLVGEDLVVTDLGRQFLAYLGVNTTASTSDRSPSPV
jgi:hypothetical protein